MKLESVIDFLDEEASEVISIEGLYTSNEGVLSELQYIAGMLIAARNHMLGVNPEPKDEK